MATETVRKTENWQVTPDWQENVDAFIAEIAKTAVERDRSGGHARHERGLIRSLGLLTLGLEEEFGGLGLSWSEILEIVQKIAVVDSAMAHIFAFHYLQIFSLKLYATPERYRFFSELTREKNLFWANATNPNDRNVLAKIDAEGRLVLDGVKSYCSGSVGADILLVTAWDERKQDFWFVVVDTQDPGVTVKENWDAFGQKQTDSGNVAFSEVVIRPDWIILSPGVAKTPKQDLRALVAQSVLINLYLGISQGALNAARDFLARDKKAWFKSTADTLRRDPYNEHHIARLIVATEAAKALEASLHPEFDRLLAADTKTVTAAERGELAVRLIMAKVAAHRAALETTSDIFEIIGASGTSQRFGLDRFWRNVRVHTLHDPIDYKLQDLGRFFLSGGYPVPTAYS